MVTRFITSLLINTHGDLVASPRAFHWLQYGKVGRGCYIIPHALTSIWHSVYVYCAWHTYNHPVMASGVHGFLRMKQN